MAERDEKRLVKDFIDSVPPLAKVGRPRKGSEEKGSRTTFSKPDRGSDYLAARIKRDRPDIADRIDSFPSIKAAARAAGIIKSPTPLTAIQAAWRKADDQQREEIMRWIMAQLQDVAA